MSEKFTLYFAVLCCVVLCCVVLCCVVLCCVKHANRMSEKLGLSEIYV